MLGTVPLFHPKAEKAEVDELQRSQGCLAVRNAFDLTQDGESELYEEVPMVEQGYHSTLAARCHGEVMYLFPEVKSVSIPSQIIHLDPAPKEAPLDIYKCIGHCPGGRPGTCDAGRIGVTCGNCPKFEFIQDETWS